MLEAEVKGDTDVNKDTEKVEEVTFCQALKMKATWICFVLTFFHQNTGLNALNMYSSTMIEKLGDKFPLSPKTATYFVGIFGFTGAAIAPCFTANLNRKTQFLYGHTTMGISMILMGIFKIN